MTEADDAVESPEGDPEDLIAKQRRAALIERRLKQAIGKKWVEDNFVDAATKDEAASDDGSTRAEEEPTSVGLAAVKLRQQQLKLRQRKQDMKLRRKLANYAIWLVIGQMLVANVFFGYYLWHNAYDAEPAVMIAWLSATVVEVVGILWVIARNLFPYRDKSIPRAGKDSRQAE